MKRVLGLLLVALLMSMAAIAQDKAGKGKAAGNAEQAITKIEDEMREATLKGDTSFAEKYVAPEYVRVYPDGTTADRQQAMDDLKNKLKYTSLEISERKVVVNGNTAVSVSKATVKGTRDGQSIDGDYRGVRTWSKQGGQWKIVAFTSTKIGAR